MEDALKTGRDDGDDDDQSCGRRQLSPFMVGRLSGLLEREYRSRVLDRALGWMEDDRRALTNFSCRQLQDAATARADAERDARRRLRLAEVQIHQTRLDYLGRCRRLLEQRRQHLLTLLERRMEKILEIEIKEHMVVKRPTVVNPPGGSTGAGGGGDGTVAVSSSRWLEEMLDENYFPSSTAAVTTTTTATTTTTTTTSASQPSSSNGNGISDWVVCGY
jgi:hypothetical protein